VGEARVVRVVRDTETVTALSKRFTWHAKVTDEIHPKQGSCRRESAVIGRAAGQRTLL